MPEHDEQDDDLIASRTFWSGTISFGLVSVPVSLFPANRSGGVSLRMVSSDGVPLARRYVAPHDDRKLEWDDIVKGYEVEKGKFVVLDDDELERLAPERTRDIDLRVFVPASDVDPIYFERAYYLLPAGDSKKAYRLLAQVMEDSDRAGIATFVMRAKEYLIAIMAENGVLRAETLRFAEEVRTPKDLELHEPMKPDPRVVRKLEESIGRLSKKTFDPNELVDESDERLRKLAEKKLKKGADVVDIDEEEMESESADVVDLMKLLQQSLQGGETKKTGKRSGESKSGKRGGGGSDDLASNSKAELYARAKKLDVPGRSEMTKDELIDAIRRSA